jgi:hypothetical protein
VLPSSVFEFHLKTGVCLSDGSAVSVEY